MDWINMDFGAPMLLQLANAQCTEVLSQNPVFVRGTTCHTTRFKWGFDTTRQSAVCSAAALQATEGDYRGI